jgi:lipopolysaccharide biosynthesis regulator YciM
VANGTCRRQAFGRSGPRQIEPEDKTRQEVLGARIELYMAAKKWDMAAAVASHLVKVEPEEAGWWISLAYLCTLMENHHHPHPKNREGKIATNLTGGKDPSEF